jgi:ubiquinone/menaquinone biosynthesis C-methylase UbiE
MSGYGVFSRYYDRLTENVEYKERADYIRTLLSAFGVNGGTVIDLACGTGSILFELLELGFDVIGIDASPEMLSIAHQKAFEKDISPPLLLCQRMQELDLYGTSEAAVCILDSINHLTDPKDVQNTFKGLHFFLEPGGIFIFDVNTLYKHREVLGNNTFVQEYDDVFCVWQNSYDDSEKTVDINLDFFEERNGVYLRSSESFTERAYSLEDLKSWLSKAGFEVLAVYDDMSTKPICATSQRAVFVTKRI